MFSLSRPRRGTRAHPALPQHDASFPSRSTERAAVRRACRQASRSRPLASCRLAPRSCSRCSGSPRPSGGARSPSPAPLPTGSSFEAAAAGPLRHHRGPVGTWRAAAGHAEITDRFAHEGQRCLHIHGGEDRRVELDVDAERATQVTMRAERWTKRAPFRFRVEAGHQGAGASCTTATMSRWARASAARSRSRCQHPRRSSGCDAGRRSRAGSCSTSCELRRPSRCA